MKAKADYRIVAIDIVPAGPRFVIAAITLGHMNEHPFPRQGRRAARVILTDPENAIRPFDLEITLDRGDSTCAYPLPEQPAEGFLRSRFKGWGEEPTRNSNPAYVEISAVPSATVATKQGDKEISSVRWGDLLLSALIDNNILRNVLYYLWFARILISSRIRLNSRYDRDTYRKQ